MTTPSPMTAPMTVAAVGVHVLDTHVLGIESIPAGSDGQLVLRSLADCTETAYELGTTLGTAVLGGVLVAWYTRVVIR